MSLRYCPRCAADLAKVEIDGNPRLRCTDTQCGHVFWNNPVPVVAAVVEHEGAVVLARNVAWPEGMFALVTGFLEAGESAEAGVLREVKEELDLDGEVRGLIGAYAFPEMNQIILAYHVVASGEITRNHELAEVMRLAPEQVRYWPAATGFAMRDWLEARGHRPEPIDLPPEMRRRVADMQAEWR